MTGGGTGRGRLTAEIGVRGVTGVTAGAIVIVIEARAASSLASLACQEHVVLATGAAERKTVVCCSRLCIVDGTGDDSLPLALCVIGIQTRTLVAASVLRDAAVIASEIWKRNGASPVLGVVTSPPGEMTTIASYSSDERAAIAGTIDRRMDRIGAVGAEGEAIVTAVVLDVAVGSATEVATKVSDMDPPGVSSYSTALSYRTLPMIVSVMPLVLP